MENNNPILNILIFLGFILVTLIVVIRVSRKGSKTADDFYAGGRGFSGAQNGAAIAGDYLSAAAFLGVTGAIAFYGYDGFLYSVGFFVALLTALLLVAELMRNVGKFTMADVLAFRLKQRPVRLAAAISTLVIVFFYLLAQMSGAGGLVSLLLGVTDTAGKSLVLIVVGALMILYVLLGGMKGTTWVQIIKAFLLVAAAAIMTIMVLWIFKFDFSALLGQAAENAAQPIEQADGTKGTLKSFPELLSSGNKYTVPLDFISLGMGLVLGTAGLPHVLMRFYTVPSAKEARKSVVWTIWLVGFFFLFTLIMGFGARALVNPQELNQFGENSAAPLLARELGGPTFGPVMLSFVSAVAFATILAVVAGLTITAAASFAHDIYANVIKKGHVDPQSEVKVGRRTVVVIGILAIIGGIGVQGQNIAFLVALAFAIAASANLPTIVYSLFWRGFTTRGALWSLYGGLATALILIIFSPAMSGTAQSMIPSADFDWFPLTNPGLVSIPVSFFLGWLGSVLPGPAEDPKIAAEMDVRSLTGHGSEEAVQH